MQYVVYAFIIFLSDVYSSVCKSCFFFAFSEKNSWSTISQMVPMVIAESATLNMALKNTSGFPPTKGTHAGHVVSIRGK